MEPEVIERVETERGELQLQRREAAFEVISNGCFLMATYNGASERALIEAGAALLQPRAPRRVLVGGLGVGYTLKAALETPGVERVTVVEIEPKIAGWNRTWLRPTNGGALYDPRTELVLDDFLAYLTRPEARGAFDLIAVDTDNGPEWTVFDQNRAIWASSGLDLLDRALAQGGVLAFWSANASPAFEALLRSRYSEVQVIPVPAALSNVDGLIFLARK